MKKISDFIFIIASSMIICILMFVVFIMFGLTATLNVFAVKGIINHVNIIDVNATIVNIKNSSLDVPNQIYFKYDFYFYHNNELRNASILCRSIDCVNKYMKYKINDNIIVYLDNNEFALNIDIYKLLTWILTIPSSIFVFLMLTLIVCYGIVSTTSYLCKIIVNKESKLKNVYQDILE